ncbi:MAG: hypothetical protein EH225_08330 [Calditrichaeota bacterium]|nr:serine hydrolase [Calditrichota bacterium]RQW02531.1 MAG: hypothetical protein EH225_08330 [Calditrichota bacterium]
MLIKLLEEHSEELGIVLQNPEKFRLQILYTMINRDQDNRPDFISNEYRLDTTHYFYPASSIKLPVAVLALEKLNEINIPGLDKETALRIDSTYSGQTAVFYDNTSLMGFPTIGNYVKKIFLVSDNDAFNRLYEFLGQREINESLWGKGYKSARINRRLEIGLSPEENRATNAMTFFRDDSIIYKKPAQMNRDTPTVQMKDLKQGKGYFKSGELIKKPIDFSYSNYISVRDLQAILKSVIFPDAVPEKQRFHLTDEDYKFLYRYMSMLPRESDIEAYQDTTTYPDGYLKFFMFGDNREQIPSHIRIFNKSGQAYGYLIDNAYIVDFDEKIEFLLTAVLQANENQIYNDDKYEYEEIGLPFLAKLGWIIYQYELKRNRPHPPDLSRFRVH